MSFGTKSKSIGIVCRDVGFLPASSDGLDRIELRIDHAYKRKGNFDYARIVAGRLRDLHPSWFDEVIIVGDGEGDVRFCTNLDGWIRSQSLSSELNGLFIKHDAVERSQNKNENAALFDSWVDLSLALTQVLHNADRSGVRRRILLFVDIDRTILFPRLNSDEHYFRVRAESIADYVLEFSNIDRSSLLESRIEQFANFATDNLNEYLSDFHDLCFKNEEVVAVTTLLLSTGAIMGKWVSPSSRSFLDLLRLSIQKLIHGGWISGLEHGESEEPRPAELIWKRDELVQHLKSVLSNLNTNKPVLCPEYRWKERKRLTRFVTDHGSAAFNVPLLGALKSAPPLTLVFVTDRPTQSLGFPTDNSSDPLTGSVIWNELTKDLV
jgi:hypothetical protein